MDLLTHTFVVGKTTQTSCGFIPDSIVDLESCMYIKVTLITPPFRVGK